jgi:hypothetical protein
VLRDIADAAMGNTYSANLAERESFTTFELKINFLNSIWIARLRHERITPVRSAIHN